MSDLFPVDWQELIQVELSRGDRAPDGLLHASSHLLGSERHMLLDVAGAPTVLPSIEEVAPMHTGTMWHEWLERRMKSLRLPYMAEVDLTPWMPGGWGGTADVFVWNPLYKAFALADVKTTSGDSVSWIKNHGAKDEHIHQVSTYWHAGKKMGLPLLKEFGIIYVPTSRSRHTRKLGVVVHEVKPLPWGALHANMKTRRAAADAYLASLPFAVEPGELELDDFLTPALAPVQGRVQRLVTNRRTGGWDLKLVPHWSAQFCSFPVELCDCSQQTETKIGEYGWDGDDWSYMPRDGYGGIEPLIEPTD